jgi:MFS family permease
MKKIPRGVWMLGFASLFMDMSSEMAHAILPLFLVGTLGASVAMVGLIDGLAEALSHIMKLFSGIASDWLSSRKWLAVAGYALSALTKPLFPLAGSATGVLVARLADRLGKGIRGAPRDAMVADFTPPELRGAAFGLRQALDTVGAVAGPLIAVGLLWWGLNDYRIILWIACVPALITVAILVFGVNEPPRSGVQKAAANWRSYFTFANPGKAFWLVLVLGSTLAAARMSEAFLVLKAQDSDVPVMFIPLVMVLMSVVYLIAVYPAGVVADRWGTKGLLFSGLAALAIADGFLASASGLWMLFSGVAFWGLHMGLTQGLVGKLVADTAPADLRGTCFGYFYLASGVATLVSSVIAGLLWDNVGPAWTFAWGAALVAIAIIPLLQMKSSNQ